MSQFYFPRNDQSAQKANSGSNRISPHEFQIVKITQAYWGVSQGGAKFICINIVNANNETEDELKIYFEGKSGEQLSGYHQINAILAFNNIAGLNQTQGMYKTYDFEHGGLVNKQGLVAQELVGAYVGVILAENYYQGQNGIKYNLNISSVYHHQTNQNAKQFLSGTPAQPGQIEQSVEYAKKSSETSKRKAESQNNQAPQYPQGMMASPLTSMQRPPSSNITPAPIEDDIPF